MSSPCRRCVACCVDASTPEPRLSAFLEANTRAFARRFGRQERLRTPHFLAHELGRRRAFDLLSALLLPLGFPRALFEWRRIGCVWAGYLDAARQEVGCLLHPARHGGRDYRRFAPFLSDPLRTCEPEFECAAWRAGRWPRAEQTWIVRTRDLARRNAALGRRAGSALRPGWRARLRAYRLAFGRSHPGDSACTS